MPFTITDLDDLKQLLRGHPEWRAELRELILTDELVALPRAFAETRTSYEARFERIERALEQLIQAQARTEQRLGELTQAQARTEQRVDKLADKQGQMLGKLLEWEYAERATTYFGNFLRGLRVLIPGRLDTRTEEVLYERLSTAQRYQVLRLDVLARGKLIGAAGTTSDEIWLAVEVSSVIDRSDIERAQERAGYLRQAGLRVIPVVAGQDITRGAGEILQNEPVLMVIDGKSEGWERALDAALQS